MRTKILLIVLLFGLIISCSDENEALDTKIYSISGVAQKGPFINGSQISISELNESLNQTGRNFTTEIINDLGEFELSEIALESGIIELLADGYYFNEILGVLSPSRLALKSLSDLTDKSSINVNILTHIIIDRVRVLFNEGEDFISAIEKAQHEILSIFEVDDITVGNFEDLDISVPEEKNAVLIAISSIFQGNNTVAELSKLLADFKEDFGIDGLIDDTNIQTELINNAKLIDPISLRNNLEELYSSLGINIQAPVFEEYLMAFIDSSDFESTLDISYPTPGSYGANLLAMESGQDIHTNVEYSIAAKFPSDIELMLKLTMRIVEGDVSWTVDESKKVGWNTVPLDGKRIKGFGDFGTAEMPVVFSGTGKITILLEKYKIDYIDEFLGSAQIELTIK